MFEGELSRLQTMASTAAVPGPLRLVLAEVSEIKAKVLTLKSDLGLKHAMCKYDPTTHNRVGYMVNAGGDTSPLDAMTLSTAVLGNLVHELTHVAVNEAYELDFINYPNPNAQNVPVREYDDSGYPTNLEVRRGKYMDTSQNEMRMRRFAVLRAKANAARAQLGDARCNALLAQFNYGQNSPHIEFDTVINQTFFWLHEWANEKGMKQADIRLERAKLGRVTGRGSDPMHDLFVSLSTEVDAAYRGRDQARLSKPARPRSYAIGGAPRPHSPA